MILRVENTVERGKITAQDIFCSWSEAFDSTTKAAASAYYDYNKTLK